jgi:fused signal recognition particle receptor
MGDLQQFDSEQFIHALFAGLIQREDEQDSEKTTE